MLKQIPFILLLLFALVTSIQAEQGIYAKSSRAPTDAVFDAIYEVLESEKFWVVFQSDIGRNLKHFEKRWGDDYNRNKLDAIRSVLVCNPWWANQVSNKDPMMLGFCPLRINLIAKSGITTALFARPTAHAEGSPAKGVLEEIENTIIGAIERGIAKAEEAEAKE